MTHEHTTPHSLAHLAYREAAARWVGDTVGADEAAAALDAATLHVEAEQWAAVYRATLADNKHG